MGFAIKFTDDPDEFPFDDKKTPAAVGQIILGDFRETFVASLFEWDRKAYAAQWTAALRELLNGADRAALITEYISPTHSSKLEWWPLYRGEGELVHVQNHILWYDQLDRDFRVRGGEQVSAGSKYSK